jgi:hypothetical protein
MMTAIMSAQHATKVMNSRTQGVAPRTTARLAQNARAQPKAQSVNRPPLTPAGNHNHWLRARMQSNCARLAP